MTGAEWVKALGEAVAPYEWAELERAIAKYSEERALSQAFADQVALAERRIRPHPGVPIP